MVFRGFTMACRFASWPTSRSPDSGKPTTEGVRFEPCLLGMTLTSLPSITQTTEFVVPRSMPTILPIGCLQYVPVAHAQTVCQSAPDHLCSSHWPPMGCKRFQRAGLPECQSDRGGCQGCSRIVTGS